MRKALMVGLGVLFVALAVFGQEIVDEFVTTETTQVAEDIGGQKAIETTVKTYQTESEIEASVANLDVRITRQQARVARAQAKLDALQAQKVDLQAKLAVLK